MTLKEILWGSGGVIVALMTLIQITPVKVNPWTAIGRAIGRALNADLIKELDEVKRSQKAIKEALDAHVRIDDERNADGHRARILRFNNELIQRIAHTREEFIEVLAEIDYYERFCATHPDYKNNRAVHAIENINRVYTERMKEHDFIS